jgi:hypothetical protein
MALLPLLFATALAVAGESHTLTYDVQVGDKVVGSRVTTISAQTIDGEQSRVIESFTDLKAVIGPVSVAYRQRLTAIIGESPASFHAVIEQDGVPSEVQARRTSSGWSVTTVDRGGVRTVDHAAGRVDLSTVDLIDPQTRYAIGRFTHVNLLSAETGDIWDGAVEPLGVSSFEIAGKRVPVEGVAWLSPEGRTEFWYDSEGYLVQYNMRLLGFRVQGRLRAPPPPGPDVFRVGVGRVQVDEREI